MSLAEPVATALGRATRTAYGFQCKCPCHKDEGASLEVKDSPDGKDILVRCSANCPWWEVKDTIGQMGLLNGHGAKANVALHLKASDWLALPIVPPIPVLPEIFDAKDKVVIIGQSKTRKSFFTEQLAMCLASGMSFLGFQSAGKKKVVLVQSEITLDNYHARCVRMAEHLGIPHPDLDQLIIVNARGLKYLEEVIEEAATLHKPDVIIIDPFYKVIQGDENKSEDIKLILRFFDRLTEKTGAAIMYVHHDKKGVSGDQQLTDRGSGSGVLARDFDSAIFLSPHKSNPNDLVVEFITRNYPPKEPITVSWWDYHFAKSNAVPEKKTSRDVAKGASTRLDQHVRAALEVIKEKWKAGYKELGISTLRALLADEGIKYKRFDAVVEELVRAGEITIETRKAEKGRESKFITPLYNREGNLFSNAVLEEI